MLGALLSFWLGYNLGSCQNKSIENLKETKSNNTNVEITNNSWHSLPARDKKITDTPFKKTYLWNSKTMQWEEKVKLIEPLKQID